MSRPSTSTSTSATAAVTFGVLGPLEVRDGTRVLDVPGRQERALLALLLTAPGRVFSVSAIVTGIWGDEPPAGAEKTVQSYVSRLRRALPGDGSSLVLTRSPGYLAAVGPVQVDAERFRTLAAAGRRDLAAGRPGAAASELRDALGLWRGEAYAEFDAPFAIAERTGLDELRLAAVEDRIAADLDMGAGPELVAELETLVGRHPWRERLWAQLMTALYRSGRQGDALGAFQRARTSLVDELGIEPGPELRAVEALVLAQDAQLLGVDRSLEGLSGALSVVGPTFVGRDAELARLLEAYDRAATGSVERVLLTGPHGIGKTRLLAELAREVQARGGLVRSGAGETWPPQAGVAVVILIDDLHRASTAELTGLAERMVGARAPLLVVGACVWDNLTGDQTAPLSRMFPDRLPVPPLRPPDIAEVVALYVPPEAVEDGVAAVAEATGVPLQVHAAASRYGEGVAATQVEQAAASMSAPRRYLSAAQERVTDGVFDLQRIRLVREAHAPTETLRVVCPYKGLAFFDVDDAPYFFGRERLVAQLVARLVDTHLLAVVGGSGSGKSSVVRAGLVAAIRAGVLPGSDRWDTVLTTPTQPPTDPAATGTRTLLVVDQFEELFTALSPTQQEEYADWLAGVAARDDVTVVVAVRSDYYAQATAHPRLSDLLAANTVLVGEMSSDELRQAIDLPAAAAGLELEPGLAETVVGDVVGEPGVLPLMSTALLSLWERRDGRQLPLAAYHELGGVHAAVSRLAEAAYGQLTPNQQSVARRILLRMAETGESGEPVRRRVPIAEVAPDGDADARAVLDTLAARRLLTVSETHAEVAHEALLREWPRLRGWLDEDEAGRQLRRHLAPAAHDWEVRDRDDTELYRGPRLAAALDWQRDHAADLTEVEHDFLRTSRRAAEAETLRRRRSIQRLRTLAAGLVGVLVFALAAGLVAVQQRNDATQASLEADVRALQAKALNEDRWDRALLYAAQAQRFQPSADSRAALLQTVQRAPEATAIFTADQPLHSIVASADGTKLAAGDSRGTVHVWDAGTRQRVQTIHGVSTFEADSLDMSPDGRYIVVPNIPVTVYAENRLKYHIIVIDLEAHPPTVRYLPYPDGTVQGVAAARFAADGRTLVTVEFDLVTGEFDGVIRYVDVESGDAKRTLEFRHVGTGCGHVSAGRRYMVACDDSGLLTAWDVDSGKQLWSSVEPDETAAAISPDGSQLVIGHTDGRIERIDVNTGDRTAITPALDEELIDLTWSPDGSTFSGVTQDRTVSVWDADTLQPAVVLRGHRGAVSQAVYSPDGETIYAAGLDGSVLAWDLTGGKGIVTESGWRPEPGFELAALAPDGSVAAASYEDGRVKVFEIASGGAFEVVSPEGPHFFTIDRLGRSVALGTFEDGAGPRAFWVRTIDVQRGELLPYRIELDPVATAADAVVTWDNKAILAAGEQQVGLWNRITGVPEAPELFAAANGVAGTGMHPDRRWAALSESGLIEVIDLRTGDLVVRIDHRAALGESLPLSPVVFSPDGRWLAAATPGGRVVVWDTRTWKQHGTWTAVRGFGIDSLVFTPDSDFLVTGGAGQAAVWNVEQGASGGVRLDVDPSRPDANVWVGVRDDGTLVTFTEGTGVREWDVAADGLLEHACTVVGRNLTEQEWDDVLPDRPYARTCPLYPDG
jgi:WD40 repeat protein/DNA-binding SARP family transcriptional activator